MSWLASLAVALVTAAVGLVLGGYVASLAAGWYRVSSFEGGAGYFVVAFALLGAVVGLLVGLVMSRVADPSLHLGTWKLLLASQVAIATIAVVVGGIARLAADVPPTLGRERLLLVVEIRWPAFAAASPATDTTERRLRLYSVSGRTARSSRDGALWTEDARREDGHWIVPGAVAVYTSRGDRMLAIEPAPAGAHGFLVPLPAHPKQAQLAWSEWMPRSREGAPLPDGFAMRFRVLPVSQPVRTQTFGPWEIATVADGFYNYETADGFRALAANARFLVKHLGNRVTIDGTSEYGDTLRVRFDRAESVALLPGAPDALLVRAATELDVGPVYLVVSKGDHVRVELVSQGLPLSTVPPITNDAARFRRARARRVAPGTIDRVTFAEPGVYYFHDALVDVQPPSVRRYAASDGVTLDPNVRPLGLSPDGSAFVRLGFGEDGEGRVLVTTNVVTGTTATLPVDAARTRLGAVDALDPAWLGHYYEWRRAGDGPYELAAREQVTPLPYRGTLVTSSGQYREYHVEPAGKAMFDALVAFLRAEMGATRTPEDEAAIGYRMTVEGQHVYVIDDESSHHVGIYMDRGADSRLVVKIGERFDAALATGKYDGLFGR
ncbi:MAG TPA: hypothetical protein VFS59_15480 [Gemmatimonadaceae bacterium]|nr:hypothetical protein [Gemmatimonadaceae bacterium]